MEFGNPIVGLEELIRSAIRSQGYESGVTGWRIARDGSAEFSVIVIRGTGTGDIVVIGSSTSPQVKIGVLSNAGFISFPTNGPVENFVSRILSARQNAGAVNEYGSMQIDGPSVDGVGATDRIQMQINSQNNDATSNANWSIRSVTHGFQIIGDKDDVTFGVPTTAPNYPGGAWTAFTPTWTTSTGANLPSFGNATLDCKWTRHGRAITARYDILFGSTTNFGAAPTVNDNWVFSLPVAAASNGQLVTGFFELHQSNALRCVARGRILGTPAGVILEISSGRPDGVGIVNTGVADSISPWTWANGNWVRGQITYESVA